LNGEPGGLLRDHANGEKRNRRSGGEYFLCERPKGSSDVWHTILSFIASVACVIAFGE
jgi:hypothetical protein